VGSKLLASDDLSEVLVELLLEKDLRLSSVYNQLADDLRVIHHVVPAFATLVLLRLRSMALSLTCLSHGMLTPWDISKEVLSFLLVFLIPQ